MVPTAPSTARGPKRSAATSATPPPRTPNSAPAFSPAFVRWLPRLLTVLALLMLAYLVVPEGSWADTVFTWLWTWVVPVTPVDFVSSVVLIMLAAALAIRKRAAWWNFLILIVLIIIVIALVALLYAMYDPKLLTWDFVTGSILPVVTLIELLRHRRHYTAKTQPRGFLKAITVLIIGLVLSSVLVLAIQYFMGGLTLVHARQILAELFGLATETESSWMLTLFGFCSGATIIIAFWTLLRSQRQAERIGFDEERTIRRLLSSEASDSLGYFATRRDRSALFTGDCTVTYRVEKGVCLVAGDPIGPHSQWNDAARAFVAHAQTYGWVPAVLAASRQGAQAYHAAGLKVLLVGDEAVLHSRDFSLQALPEVHRSVAKLRAQGYGLRIRHQAEIPQDELTALARFADDWRDGETERGFSMALGRFGDGADGQCLVVEALFPDSEAPDSEAPDTESPHARSTAGLLSFVPWGTHGVSLDLMRRHPLAENGVTEFMVAGLMEEAPELGIASASLNFAVFRSAFEQGKELGAGPIKKLWRNILLFASRFWQLESLYRSNEKYHPEWVPRMLCYSDSSDLARIGLAVSIAEGFLTPPSMLGTRAESQPTYTPAEAADLLPVAPDETPVASGPRVPAQVRHRLEVREAMLDSGTEPYPAEARGEVVSGRVLAIRDHGGVVFVDLRCEGNDVQLLAERRALDPESFQHLRRWVARGDRIDVTGTPGTSRNGTASVLVSSWSMAAKSLRPWPSPREGIRDPETKVRRRYLDFTLDPASRSTMISRASAIRAVRETLQDQDFLEVETPILQTVHGGANARPFHTHINAYHLDLFLRIAPELYLKRLLVGGFERVFEIGRNFRNEGVDATHNPEFSMLEAYQAGGDYSTMRTLTRSLVISAAEAALGTTVIRGEVDGVVHEIDLAEEWTTISLTEAVSERLGVEVTTGTDIETMRAHARAVGIDPRPRWGWGTLLQEIYEEVAESHTIAPTFYTDFPAETSPLTRQHRRDPMLAEKWDLIIFGSELATAYSELVDPVIQRQRLTAQSLEAAGGDPEAMALDEDFLLALEHGMPPAGGMGMGLDRLVMLLTNQSIRSTITFPLAKPKGY
ncbi:lysyl-tRNA synthetase class 2 [Brevibacterium epidermidis]|jgi:lysyl-tRNA synthetase class 2|uniref:Lysine--tRNA ligase n=1 Tax=Brevibacterium epidermidis TaxID=1698 RepID=A0ABV4EKR3_BREEP